MDIINAYYELIEAVKAFSGMSNPLLHIHAGMGIYLTSQFLLGTRRASWMALSIVLEIELFNEVMNYLYHGSWRWADTSQDILLTLFWPSMCVVVSKYRRWKFTQAQRKHAAIKATLGFAGPEN